MCAESATPSTPPKMVNESRAMAKNIHSGCVPPRHAQAAKPTRATLASLSATRCATLNGVKPNSTSTRAFFAWAHAAYIGCSAELPRPYDFAVPSPRANSTMAPDRRSEASCVAGVSFRLRRLMPASASADSPTPASAASAQRQSITARNAMTAATDT